MDAYLCMHINYNTCVWVPITNHLKVANQQENHAELCRWTILKGKEVLSGWVLEKRWWGGEERSSALKIWANSRSCISIVPNKLWRTYPKRNGWHCWGWKGCAKKYQAVALHACRQLTLQHVSSWVMIKTRDQHFKCTFHYMKVNTFTYLRIFHTAHWLYGW